MGRSKHQKAKADDNLGKLLSKRVGTTPAARAAIEATENGPRKDQPDQEASVLERNDLSEIIAMADMENRSLRADKNQATVVCDAAGDVTTPEEQERRRIAAQKRYREALKVRLSRNQPFIVSSTPHLMGACVLLHWHRRFQGGLNGRGK